MRRGGSAVQGGRAREGWVGPNRITAGHEEGLETYWEGVWQTAAWLNGAIWSRTKSNGVGG